MNLLMTEEEIASFFAIQEETEDKIAILLDEFKEKTGFQVDSIFARFQESGHIVSISTASNRIPVVKI